MPDSISLVEQILGPIKELLATAKVCVTLLYLWEFKIDPGVWKQLKESFEFVTICDYRLKHSHYIYGNNLLKIGLIDLVLLLIF